jgi:uncharacterized membrane protein
VLNITLPELSSGHHGELGHRLLDRWPEVRSYIISFAVISYLWFRHHGFFRALARIDGVITALNLVYLGMVAFLPYPTRVLGLYGDQGAAIALYAGTAASVSLVAGLLRAHATRAGLLSDAGRRHLARREPWGIAPAIFLVSIPIGFVSTTAAELTWILLLSLPGLRRLRPSS